MDDDCTIELSQDVYDEFRDWKEEPMSDEEAVKRLLDIADDEPEWRTDGFIG